MRDWWEARFLRLELILGTALCSAGVAWSELVDHGAFVGGIPSEVRVTLYGTLATLLGSLLGFVITSSSIVLIYWANAKLALVRASEKSGDVWNVFQSAIRVLGFATVVALVGLVLARQDGPLNVLLYANALGFTLSAFRMARVVWVLDYIVRIVTKPEG